AAWRQWLLKILTNMFTNVICVICLIGVGYLVLGSAFRDDIAVSLGWVGIVQLSLLAIATFPAFWSACATSGTIRAAVWVFPMVGSIEALAFGGSSIGELRAISNAIDWVLLRAHPYPPPLGLTYFYSGYAIVPILAAPFLILAAVQSYRLFRTERLESF